MIPPRVQLLEQAECERLEAFLVERIYEFNVRATGYSDGKLLGGSLQDEAGEIIAAFNGHTWGGCCVVAHLWVHESHRRDGLGRTLLCAAEQEAARRGCEQMVVATHSFQAPSFYERLGYEKQAVVSGQPKGYDNIIYCKRLNGQNGT